DLSKTNWFRVGGPAEWLFKPENTQDLADFMKVLPPEIPVTVLGVGSNVIVRDGGIEGVVVKLGRAFVSASLVMGHESLVEKSENKPKTKDQRPVAIATGAAMLDLNVALFACDHGFAGLEFLSGIPGTIGGAVRMNAGAYGREIKDVLIECEVVLRSGEVKILTNEECGFSYRKSALPEGAIVTQALLAATPGERIEIAGRIQEISRMREDTQPIRSRTGGSTFKNPEGHKAWELIDKAGCRGMTLGGAQVSEKHCNFLINTGNATASDLENLGNKVIELVREKTGITLEWEIKFFPKEKI
ncbi:MAG: UDP-N-acetylmuramate dehydrogenase, partial [Alphaproteobacteria bacterium]|nr:UDP-N-acetylmuramate dehydrogenase [Alphaproteobacteria bacterium]